MKLNKIPSKLIRWRTRPGGMSNNNMVNNNMASNNNVKDNFLEWFLWGVRHSLRLLLMPMPKDKVVWFSPLPMGKLKLVWHSQQFKGCS